MQALVIEFSVASNPNLGIWETKELFLGGDTMKKVQVALESAYCELHFPS